MYVCMCALLKCSLLLLHFFFFCASFSLVHFLEVLKTGPNWPVRLVESRFGGYFGLEKRPKTGKNQIKLRKLRTGGKFDFVLCLVFKIIISLSLSLSFSCTLSSSSFFLGFFFFFFLFLSCTRSSSPVFKFGVLGCFMGFANWNFVDFFEFFFFAKIIGSCNAQRERGGRREREVVVMAN